jgi:hypothetical protein
MNHEDLARMWLDAMFKGLDEHHALLCAALPRVSPEYAVVMAATAGLARALRPSGRWHVHLEHPLPAAEHGKRGKCDVVVRSLDGDAAHYFEFKALWWGGLGENVTGIKGDLHKLSELPPGTGYVVAFAYAISEAPSGLQRYHTKHDLAEVRAAVIERLGDKQPFHQSAVITLEDLGLRGSAQLLAWRADG